MEGMEIREELIVSVVETGGMKSLCFHSDRLHSFLEGSGYSAKDKVTVIGVIGEPNSNKTFIGESILYKLQNPDKTDVTWLKKWLHNHEWEKLFQEKKACPGSTNFPQGIQIRSCPRQENTGVESMAVFVLDILTHDTGETVYNQLVNSIISLSSIIVYSAELKKVDKYWWSPESSSINSLDAEFLQQLFIVIQEPELSTRNYEGSIWQKFRSAEEFLDSADSTTSGFNCLKILSRCLRSKYEGNSCHLFPPSYFNPDFSERFLNFLSTVSDRLSNVCLSQPATFGNLPQLFFQVGRSLRGVTYAQQEPESAEMNQDDNTRQGKSSFQSDDSMDVDSDSKSFSKTSSSNNEEGATKIEQIPSAESTEVGREAGIHEKLEQLNPSLVIQPKALTHTSVSSETFYLESFCQLFETEYESELDNLSSSLWNDAASTFAQLGKEIAKKAMDKFLVEHPIKLPPDFANQINMNLPPIHSHFEGIHAQNFKKYTELSAVPEPIFQEAEMRLNHAIRDDNWADLFHGAHTFVNRQIIQNCNERQLEGNWKLRNDSRMTTALNYFLADLWNCQSIMGKYKEAMDEFILNTICLNSDEFETAHSASEKCTWTIQKPNRAGVVQIAKKGINLFRQKHERENEAKLRREEEMARQAVQFVLNEYHMFMSSFIVAPPGGDRQGEAETQGDHQTKQPILIFTDAQIKERHKMVLTHLLQHFLKVPEFHYTNAWERGYRHLVKELNGEWLLEIYLQRNQVNVRALANRRQMAMQEADKTYRQKLTNLIQLTQVNPTRLKFFHQKAEEDALKIYEEEMGGNFDRVGANSAKWGEVLREKFRYSLQEFTVAVSPGTEPDEPPPVTAPFGVGIYWTPTMVIGTVWKQGADFHAFVEQQISVCLSPLIAFMNDQILYGDETNNLESRKSTFNLHQLLFTPPTDNEVRHVEIYGEEFSFRKEEIIAIFLRNFKLELELKFCLKVPITSAVLTFSPFTPITTKHTLKKALFLAGFQSSRLLHSTTAVGISEQIQRMLSSSYGISSNRDYPILVVHEAPGVFDVACLHLKKISVEVRAVFGLPDLKLVKMEHANSWNPLNWIGFGREKDEVPFSAKALRKLIDDCLRAVGYNHAPHYRLEDIILIQSEPERPMKSSGGTSKQIPSKLDVEGVIKGVIHRNQINRQDEFSTILAGATALDFKLNKNLMRNGHQLKLDYTEAFPLTLNSVEEFGGKSCTILVKNAPLPANFKSIQLVPPKWTCDLLVREMSAHQDKDKGTEFESDRFQIPISVSLMSDLKTSKDPVLFKIGLTEEGLIQISEAQTKHEGLVHLRVNSPAIGLEQSMQDRNDLRRTIQEIFPATRIQIPTNEQKAGEDTAQAAGISNHPGNVMSVKNIRQEQPIVPMRDSEKKDESEGAKLETNNELENSRDKLATSIIEVKKKLAGGGGLTNKLILARIEELMAEGQALLDTNCISVPKLSAQLQKLQAASARIKI